MANVGTGLWIYSFVENETGGGYKACRRAMTANNNAGNLEGWRPAVRHGNSWAYRTKKSLKRHGSGSDTSGQ
jgi:hypothetical protein